MKRQRLFFGSLVISLLSTLVFPLIIHADFVPNLLMDDTVFSDTSSMTAAQIDAFLNSQSSSCISQNSGFESRLPTGYSPSSGFTFGSFASAGQVIAQSAQAYGLNPQVLLVTLQKEQSLVTGSSGYCNNGDENKYAAAVGYDCPDSGSVYNWSGVSLYWRNGVEHTSTGPTCVDEAAAAGFSQQIIRAAWLLKFGQERSEGNVNWAVINGSWDNSDDPGTCYGGPMTEGTLQRCQNSTPVFYDGYDTIDGTATHMDTGATAALYWYTPHFSGNENFVALFDGWFGSTISAGYYSCHNATNVSGAATGQSIVANQYTPGQPEDMTLLLPNNTGSACVEVHVWNPGEQTWITHVATNLPAINPEDTQLVMGDIYGTGRDELILVIFNNTGSGMVEVHIWDPTYQHWLAHIVTNLPEFDPAVDHAQVVVGDLDGADNKAKLSLILYDNTASGKVEVHTWWPGEQNWMAHIATNLPSFNPVTSNAEIVAGDLDGDNKDKLSLVLFNNTGSGKVEVHTWAPGEQTWLSHVATNLTMFDPTASEAQVTTGNLDGSLEDKLSLILFNHTGSGNVEIHTWAPGEQTWAGHAATNLTEF